MIDRLKKRAEIRRQIPTRKSVIDRIADLLEEAAKEIEYLNIQAIGLAVVLDVERNMK